MRRIIALACLWFSAALVTVSVNLVGCGGDGGGGGGPVAPKGSATRKVVLMKDNFFSPKDVSIGRGDTIVWFNAGNMPHTTTSGTAGTKDGLWDSGSGSPSLYMQTGERFERTFTDTTGVYPYYCEPHWSTSGMVGTVTVTP